MGFLHQLGLLLWKNFTLKKRSPFVLLFELFIPLVLFVILLFIRKRQPPHQEGTYRWGTQALPSSGALPIMQSFCEENNQQYNDSHPHRNTINQESSRQFLLQLQTVAEQHDFFYPGYTPREMEQLPAIYRDILDGPANLHMSFKHAQDFNFSSVLKSASHLQRFLVHNISMPDKDANALLHATVNMKEVYRLLFGSYPTAQLLSRGRRDVAASPTLPFPDLHKLTHHLAALTSAASSSQTDLLSNPDIVSAVVADIAREFEDGLLSELMNSTAVQDDAELVGFLMHLFNDSGQFPFPMSLDPQEVAEMLKAILLSPQVLHKGACDPDEFAKLFVPTSDENSTDLAAAGELLCNMTDGQTRALSDLLKAEIQDQTIIHVLNLQPLNVSALMPKVQEFLSDVEKFYKFQTTLYELSTLAETLPQDGCDFMQGDNSTTDAPKISPNKDKTKPTPTPPVDEKTKKKNKFAGLLKFWDGMQKTICGHDPPERPQFTPPPGDDNDNDTSTGEDGTEDRPDVHRQKRSADDELSLEDFNLGDLGLNSGQKKNLEILLHVLYSNPKVLYAPNNTAAQLIIKKANETFKVVDMVNSYAREWLNISSDLRAYLMKNSTKYNIQAIKKIQQDLREKSSFMSVLTLSPAIAKFVNLSIPDAAFFLHEMDTIDNAACTWLTLMSGINVDVFKGFSTEWEMVDFFLNKQYHQNVSVVAALVFENLEPNTTTLPAHIRYKIRQNATFTPNTKRVRDRYWYPGPGSNDYPYYSFGFLWIQDIIERAIINVQVGRDVVEPGSYMIRLPYPCWLYDQFVFMIEHVMPLCLTISWVYSVAMLVQSIVYEKEQRLKEVMKMMGLSNAIHWCAWFITTFLQFSITMATLTAMLKYGKVLTYSDPLVVFTTLEIFAIATIAFCFLISTLYSKAKVAAACAGIVYFLTYVPYMYVAIKEDVAKDSISSVVKTLVSLFSTTAFGLGGKYFAFYEEEGVGVQWSNINVSPVEDDQFNLLMVLLMMIFDAFIYSILAWYIENVFPGSYGLPKPYYFPFTRSYWCGGQAKIVDHECSLLDLCRNKTPYSIMEEDQACAMARDPEYASKFEAEPGHLTQGVCIDNLTKVYKTGKKLAVKNLSLNLYEGQITSFLGHNGAGKTTTMSILTGLFPPTSGSATIYGHDIRTDMEVIRQSLGMCPQHNVLFDKLTVEEHLWFYARLKGMKTSDINTEMDMMFDDLGLPQKRKSRVDCLSGGMQRKLSVAIAFVGGSRTVILDEPTAGVDPYARRAIWDLLIKYKNGRTILLSTHHMDEADLLGDRIGIISNGEIKCCGSSLFLKNTFCEGYHLYLVKKEQEEDVRSTDDIDPTAGDPAQGSGGGGTFATRCEGSKVTEFIQKHVSTAYLELDSKRELHYILPYSEAKKGNFEKLFQALECGQDNLHISSYGVADSTLEEVFLQVTEQAAKDNTDKDDQKALDGENKPEETQSQPSAVPLSDLLDEAAGGTGPAPARQGTNHGAGNELELNHITESVQVQEENATNQQMEDEEANSSPSNNQDDLDEEATDRRNMELLSGRGSYVLSQRLLLLNHFRAVIVKRFHYITRNWKGLFSQILLPALFVSVAMTVALSAPKDEDLPPLELSPSQYFNLTQPKGNYIPYSNSFESSRGQKYLYDAGPVQLIGTFHMPSGVGATCVLKSPFNSSFDMDILRSLNVSHRTLQLLSRYYEEGCERVFVPGIHLDNYVPNAAVISNKGKLQLVTPQHTHKDPIPKKKYYPDCFCKADHSGYACSDSGYTDPPHFRVVTRDIMQDITTKNTYSNTKDYGNFYLYTTDEYRLHRYGAFTFGTEQKYVPENFGKDSPTLFRTLAVRGRALAWFNNKGYHSMPVYLNTLNNAILRANLPKSKGHPAAYGITVTNHPMNRTNNILNMDYILQGADVLISIFIIVAMSFVPASFVVFLVYERHIKAKHLQFVSGLNPVMYWLANYVWDMCNYVIPAICIIVILLAFQIPAYVSSTNLPAVIALFFLYGWSMTPLMYPATFFFKEPSTAYICLIVINLFTGITCIVSSFLLEIFSYDKDLEKVHNILKDVFLMFPNYCLGRGLMDIAFNQYKNEFYFKTGQYDKMQSPFQWDLITRKLVVMSTMGFVFFIVTLLCEYRFFIKARGVNNYKPSSLVDEDADVAAERKRVLRGSGKKDLLRLENITKVYKTRKLGHQLAVDRLSIGVPAGECFGLLGVNGAGKTTTFKMLTGDLRPTSGDAFLNRYSIRKDLFKVQQNIGYCPQFDALFDELTAREHVQLYSRLRGVPPSEEKQIVEWAMKKLSLSPYANRPSGTYSGGNKRKLSTAIALIGHPPLIFMDEPTTGMDPHSRRFLWDLILNLIKDGRSVILTSHSMEECEALCTRLAIMVNGQFKCLGSTQHLKHRYGDGYTVSIRLRGPNYERTQRQTQRFVTQAFPEAIVKECHYNLLQFELKCQNISLAYAFSKLEEAQKDLNIEDYSISQNTLDNVFINFVKQQMEIVQETGPASDSSSRDPATVAQQQRTRALSSTPPGAGNRSATSGIGRVSALGVGLDSVGEELDDVELLRDISCSQMQLETEDDDEPLLNFDETGTHLTLLSMDPVNV